MRRTETRVEAVELLVRFGRWLQRVPLGDGDVVLGRAPECDVQLADGRLSRRHCRILPSEDGGWLVEDLGSQAGTFLQGIAVTGAVPLRPGDRLQAGPIEAQLEIRTSDDWALSGDPGRDARNIGALLRTVEDLHRTQDLDTLLRTIVDRAVRLAGADRGALLLATAGTGFEAVVARDSEGRDLPGKEVLSRTLPIRSIQTSRAVVLTDVAAPEQQQQVTPSVLREELRSVLCVPLPGTEGPVGVLYVDARRPAEELGPAELAVFEALAAHSALALERARFREEQIRHERETRLKLQRENVELKSRLGPAEPICQSARMRHAVELVRQVALSDATVLLQGETGSGKEVLAQTLHRTSARSAGPLVVVDCGAIPEGLIESELFGHEKGAFTGAVAARPGRFREAEGGTIFLDEIGELPLGMQSRLLRVLQERRVQPVGRRGQVPVDARVVCATHRDLQQQVAEGRFRLDLYYRISVFTVGIPPLRERSEDIALLAAHFLDRFAAAFGTRVRGFTREATEALLEHPWPGNVRELENRVQRAALLARGPYVTRQDLGLGPADAAEAEAGEKALPFPPLQKARGESSEHFERAYVTEALRHTKGNVTRAAALAGVSKQMLRRLMRRHAIERRLFLSGPD